MKNANIRIVGLAGLLLCGDIFAQNPDPIGAIVVTRQQELDSQIIGLDAELAKIAPCRILDSDPVFERIESLSKDLAELWARYFDDVLNTIQSQIDRARNDDLNFPVLVARLKKDLDVVRQEKAHSDQRLDATADAKTGDLKEIHETLMIQNKALVSEMEVLQMTITELETAALEVRAVLASLEDLKTGVESIKRKHALVKDHLALLLKSKRRAKDDGCKMSPNIRN